LDAVIIKGRRRMLSDVAANEVSANNQMITDSTCHIMRAVNQESLLVTKPGKLENKMPL
jgi:hypothetical protein